MRSGDYMSSTDGLVAELLERGVPVLAYSGDPAFRAFLPDLLVESRPVRAGKGSGTVGFNDPED